jgi:small subunit ribosomal protein S3Ae
MAEKQRKRTIDKWKKKKTFKVFASDSFEKKEIAETIALKEEHLLNRKISVSARDLTGQIKKQHIDFYFKISNVQGLKAYTKLVGIEIKPTYLKRLVRRRTTKIESNQKVVSKNNEKFKIKTVVITQRKATNKQTTAIRKIVMKKISEASKKQDFEAFIQEIVFGGILQKILNEIKKIAPIKRIEVAKISLIEG